jgi:uncharacterized protein (DUF697 family)
MNKKKLPKAVLITASELREAGNARARPDTPGRNVIEMVPKQDNAAVPALPAAAPSSAQANTEATWRRRQAIAIVERHANMAVMGGMLPIPILNVAGTTAILVHMVGRLSRLYGVPFERNRARATIVALMGGVLPTGLASATAWGLLQIVPGANVFGLVVSSVSAGACARSLGALFIDHFETGASLADFPQRMLR